MKFGKTYSALIVDPAFPEEWRDKAINYRLLKKLINQVVIELQSLGLNPDVLQRLMVESVPNSASLASDGNIVEVTDDPDEPKVTYEVSLSPETHSVKPQIRLKLPPPHENGSTANDPSLMSSSVPLRIATTDPLWALRQRRLSSSTTATDSTASESVHELPSPPTSPAPHGESSEAIIRDASEVIIPLESDSAFLQLLQSALEALSNLYKSILQHCETEVQTLTDIISASARPASESRRGGSDLDTWRKVFQLWVELEIFESLGERAHGERNVEDAEKRLTRFAEEVVRRNLDDKKAFKFATSREALKRFYALNVLVLDLKKFQLANAEATRKILKKHEKRTSLPSSVVLPSLSLVVRGSDSLPHVLLCSITQTLLPVVPSIDDYECMICTSIAFKPIRLGCGHLFCVRCLVKMQKSGKKEHEHCPLCRAPTVFKADKTNLDTAMMNFMIDWFPTETKIKARENSDEAAQEMAREMGLDQGCCIM